MGNGTSIVLPTGFTDLDRLIGGVCPGSILAIAGLRSVGKTTLSINLAVHWAILGIPAAYFSAPTAYRDVAIDVFCYMEECPRSIAREVFALDGDQEYMPAVGPHIFDDTPRLSSAQIRSRLANEVESLGRPLGAVIVDRPDLLDLDSRYGTERERMAAIMQALRAIAIDLNVAIVVTSDVGRRVEARYDDRPQLTDFHASMAPIAEAADVVLLLYRDEVYHVRSTIPGIAEVEVARNRYGPCGTLWLGFDGACARFTALDAVADQCRSCAS